VTQLRATVCKIIDFPAAHHNTHHDGHCKRNHGHTWTLEIHCHGQINTDDSRHDFGMVCDFSLIMAAYKSHVEPYVEHEDLNNTLDLPEYTTEYIAAWIYDQLKPHIPLHRIRLWEGKTSFAEITNGDRIRA
jgi:6-pyruvoyltetrahydropterin/6-carboxytetrahydropterin synthase